MPKILFFETVLILGLFLTCTAAYSCSIVGASSRLKSYCFTNEITDQLVNKQQLHLLDYLYKSEGYSKGLGLPTIVQDTKLQYFATPIIDYSTNINGGNPNKQLELGSLVFEGDSDLFRKQGGVVGIRIGANGRQIFSPGRYLDFSLDGSLTRSLNHDLWIGQNSLSVCSKNHLVKYWYMDTCTTSARTKKEFTDSVLQTVSYSFARLFTSGGNSYHQASAGVLRRFENSYAQNQILLGINTIHGKSFFSAFSLKLGESLPEILSTKLKVDAMIGTSLLGRSASLSLSYSKAENGQILDFEVNEVTTIISLNYALTPRVSIIVGYSNTDSNVDYFDRNEPSFGVEFSPIKF